MRFRDRVVIITGASRGIGKAAAFRFAEEGAKVVVAARTETTGIVPGTIYETVEEIKQKGGEALAVKVDVGIKQDIDNMAKQAVEHFGRIDVLVNNAAAFPSKPYTKFPDPDEEEWDRLMNINLKGYYLCTFAVIPFMKAQGKGKIVNISSDAVFSADPYRVHYLTTKMGQIGFTRGMARELAEYGININAVTPGFTAVERSLKTFPKEMEDRIVGGQAIKRREQASDLAGPILFLASDDADFITGQTLNVNGGQNYI
ncbi:MAG: 3-oxoacyl-(acyl-carrier-protein) reductase FabG [Syntrophorhabdus sp. PtaU1.Bin153]|nr:MAG: 3-oxoacyl-(acyl-carrier-protein) reductase FabG [Syntrophorhabdus sp. PtaU1.Bin153]